MKLSQHQLAGVSRAKIVEYLLSAAHPAGRSKARFFTKFGFQPERWDTLSQALTQHALENDVRKADDSAFGTRYTVEGPLSTPDGRRPVVRSVWFVESGESAVRFVTAYPLARRR